VLATAIALFLVGSLRTLVTGKNPFRSGFEILVIGGVAASIAFFVGWFINSLLT
jgi:VIT1/CCC1 family predicted Fe2+/Mn2+ transporter